MQHFWTLFPALLVAFAILYAAWVWQRRKRIDPYDLRRLHDAHYEAPLASGEEPDETLVTEESGPYCSSCDEAYPAGTSVCRHCRRPL